MTDKKTRLLLLAIAGGLWANAFMPILAPRAAHADDDSDVILQNIASDISDMKDDLSAIAGGTCTNNEICK